jgi:pyruvate dehydrogenase E1 component alpha subunit/2-oxoisovalerate dehydrogenase E1 component alpha subunit
VAPLIRNLGSVVARGVRPRDIYAQYMAKGDSPTRGRDLNLHFSHIPPFDSGEPIIIGPVSMLGDLIPVMGGVGLGARMRGRRVVTLTYIGDGGTSTGVFHEGLNFAAVQKLPLVLIAEDNKYAYSTPIPQQMAIARIDQRAEAYAIPHEMIDGNDMLAVYDAARRAVDCARAGAGPTLIGVDTMRMKGHAEHDDMRYVPAAMLDQWKRRDPVAMYRARLLEMAVAKEQELAEVDRMSKAYADAEAGLAEEMPLPDPAFVSKGVYAGDEYFQPRLEIVQSPFAAEK